MRACGLSPRRVGGEQRDPLAWRPECGPPAAGPVLKTRGAIRTKSRAQSPAPAASGPGFRPALQPQEMLARGTLRGSPRGRPRLFLQLFMHLKLFQSKELNHPEDGRNDIPGGPQAFPCKFSGNLDHVPVGWWPPGPLTGDGPGGEQRQVGAVPTVRQVPGSQRDGGTCHQEQMRTRLTQ